MSTRKRTPRRRATLCALLADELLASDVAAILGVETWRVEAWREKRSRPPRWAQRFMVVLLHAARRWGADLRELLPGRLAARDLARDRAWERAQEARR